MDKQCSTSTGQCSEVCDNSPKLCVQEISERCSVRERNSDYTCNLCNKSFASEGYLNKHIRIHVAHKPHVCNICNKSFAQNWNLKNHLLTHSGERHHICKICNKSFLLKQALKVHFLTHSEKRPHVCNICNKSFARRKNLEEHFFTHSGQKPHACNICSKRFARKCHLNRHSLIHSRKNVKSISHLGETSENSHENNHPKELQVIEEIYYTVQEENDNDEENSNIDVGEIPVKSDVDSHDMSCNVKEENIHDEMNDILKEEHDIDNEKMVC